MSECSAMPLLTVSALLVEASERPLLVDFNLDVEPGMLIEISGLNGAGKTTLLRYLAGIRRAYRGTIDYHGHGFAYVGQKPGLNSSFTVMENVKWITQNSHQRVAEADLNDVLADLGMKSRRDTPVGSLSAGQIRRCGLACLRVLNAKIWLLDEPLTSLDASGVDWLKESLSTHRARDGAAIVATHSTLNLPDTQFIDLNAP